MKASQIPTDFPLANSQYFIAEFCEMASSEDVVVQKGPKGKDTDITAFNNRHVAGWDRVVRMNISEPIRLVGMQREMYEFFTERSFCCLGRNLWITKCYAAALPTAMSWRRPIVQDLKMYL